MSAQPDTSRLEALRGREYWRSLEELARTEDFREHLHREFRHPVPMDGGIDRRELLTLMGASMALAGLTGCVRQPTERVYPYVRPPEEMVPGEPLYYATAHVHGGYARGILVESYEGRPTKIEGNELHPTSRGGTDVFAQGFILNMYDPDRSQTLTEKGEIRAWSSFIAAMKVALERDRASGGRGAGLRFLTGTVTSPTLVQQLHDVLGALPYARWVTWEPAGRENVAEGARMAFGESVEARYDFAAADVVVSLDADFLGGGPAMPRVVRDFASRRRGKGSNRLYVAESTPTLTGAKADHRRPMAPAQIEELARAIATGVGALGAGSPAPADPFAAAVVEDLKAHRGASLVVAGESQPPAIHALAHAVNDALGNAGKTVTYTDAAAGAPLTSQASTLPELVADMAAGKVSLLVILGGNPVFDAPADLEFGKAMDRVPLRVHLGLYEDETSRLCHWHVAQAHPLESWSDARSLHGTVTILQPLIAPLYGGKTAHEVLAAFTDQPDKSAHDIVKDYWKERLPGDFETAWRTALHDGLVKDSGFAAKSVRVDTATLQSKIQDPKSKIEAEGLTVLFRPDPTVWDGAYANNGWLQELPKPLTKLTWDNVAMIAPSTAQKLGVRTEDVVELSLDGRRVEAPVWILPGQAEGCVTVHFGNGRTRGGRVANGVGFDAYALRTTKALWSGGGLKVAKTLRRAALATTQHHHSMEGRGLVRSVTADRYAADPRLVSRMGEEPPAPSTTLYPQLPTGAYAWGLSIDLSTCVGCNACVIACQSENNIPVVGKDQVARGRAMQWIRIDRYYTGGLEAPDTLFQPVTCMHCEDAPCETVCPVAATSHSAEGLNQMIYNRCVGTRYCSNNCPYKVRRFNFYLYSDYTTEVLKMVRNPEVTVRSRGVMEKCTYCVQRINRARYAAEKENRPIKDGEIVTACQQACPAGAIVFGNILDPESAVSKVKSEMRNYGLLTELGTRPRTSYLAHLTNPNPKLAGPARREGEGETERGHEDDA